MTAACHAPKIPNLLCGALIAGAMIAASASAEVLGPQDPAAAPSTSPPAPAAEVASASSSALAAPPTAPNQDSAAKQFVEVCSGCHTLGGGVARGPDLGQVGTWPNSQLTQAIKSMERKVGPLATPQIESLVLLLKDKQVQARLRRAREKSTQTLGSPAQAPDSLLGGALFFGREGLRNGGIACSSCHQFHGEGGDLGPDLSRFADSSEIDAMAPTIARASFPVMRAAYADHPITEQEARHLAAFLKQAKAQRPAASFAETSIAGFGVGIGAFALALAAIMTRPKGVRARLIQRAAKR